MIRGVQAVKARDEPKTTFLCLSNSNSVFIDTILKVSHTPPLAFLSSRLTDSFSQHHGLEDQFVEVITNPAEFQANGLLSLKRRVDPAGEQHGCKVGCSANMCKGAELEAFMARHGGWEHWDRVVYVGDGGNDFCPLLHLRSSVPSPEALSAACSLTCHSLADKTSHSCGCTASCPAGFSRRVRTGSSRRLWCPGVGPGKSSASSWRASRQA